MHALPAVVYMEQLKKCSKNVNLYQLIIYLTMITSTCILYVVLSNYVHLVIYKKCLHNKIEMLKCVLAWE